MPNPFQNFFDKRVKPTGALPRNLQNYFVIGLAVVMVAIISFSGSRKPKNTAKEPEPPRVGSMPTPEAAHIQQLRDQLAQATRQADYSQSQFQNRPQQLQEPEQLEPVRVYSPPVERPIDPFEIERKKREERAPYAASVVVNLRDQKSDEKWESHGRAFSNTERASQTPGTANSTQSGTTAANISNSVVQAVSSATTGKRYRVDEGTILDTVLANRLDGSFSGPVKCLTLSDVYSQDREHLLIPRGSRVLGETSRVEALGQQRLAIVFHRLKMPDGYSVDIEKFKGLDQTGETGIRDKTDHHYLQLFSASLAIGAIAGLSLANTRYGSDQSAGGAYGQGVSTSLGNSSLRILERYLNVLPTITIEAGHRIEVYISRDLLLPAYENHPREIP